MIGELKFSNSGPCLTIDQVEAFEAEIGGQLPDDYKHFLLNINGGFCEPKAGFRWNGKIHKVPGFSIYFPTSEYGLRGGLRNLRELNVDGFLPFAGSSIDGDVCVNFREKIGTIWLALYSRDNGVPVDAFMMPLASSFTEFMNSLVVVPEVYCPIEDLGENGTPEDLAKYLSEGKSLNAISKNGNTILCEAIRFHNMRMIQACIERGINLSGSIHGATFTRCPDLVKMFVDAGADINERDEYGDTPLKYVGGTALPGAEGALNRELRDLLIELGAVT